MAFIVEKKIGKNVYVYSVESVWSKDEKKPKKKYTYVGKKDKTTGTICEKKPPQKPKSAEDFGARYFALQMMKHLKIDKLLAKHFPNDFEQIVEIVAFQVAEAKPSYLMHHCFGDETKSKKFCSQNISLLFKNIGLAEDIVQAFQEDWLEMHKCQAGLFYDITSFSSYSKQSEIVEWGYNRDCENLPQINFGILYGTTSKLPLRYKIYQGSVNDVKTFNNIHREIVAHGMSNFTICFDRGFYSASNLAMVKKSSYEIIMPMPFSTKEAITLAQEKVSSFDNLVNFDGDTMYCKTFPVTIGRTKFFASVFQNERRRINELNSFTHEFMKLEKNIMKSTNDSSESMQTAISSLPEKFSECFEFVNEDGKVTVRRNVAEIERATSRMGKVLLITKHIPASHEELITNYRARDMVEKSFDIMKNEMNESRLRVASTESIRGRLFVNFLCLIINTCILNKMKDVELRKRLSIAEVICEMKKIKLVNLFDGGTCLTEMSKRQREIFELYAIPIPQI